MPYLDTFCPFSSRLGTGGRGPRGWKGRPAWKIWKAKDAAWLKKHRITPLGWVQPGLTPGYSMLIVRLYQSCLGLLQL